MPASKRKSILRMGNLPIVLCLGAGVQSLGHTLSLPAGPDKVLAITRWTLTFFAATWYTVRYLYTMRIAAPSQPFPGEILSIVISFVGASTFLLSTSHAWFVGLAAALALGTLKDLEIILEQRSVKHSRKARRLQQAYLINHECYSVVRDLSMAAWWVVYGVLPRTANARELTLLLLFGAPFSALVALWTTLVATRWWAEREVFGTEDA